jgi:polysaccharide export outer membrane protein
MAFDANGRFDATSQRRDTYARMRLRPVLLSVLSAGSILIAIAMGAQEYEIGPGDVLNVIVLGQAGMTGEMAVDAGGMLSFPFLGPVKATGLSALELERKLVTLLSDGYLRRPQVSVSVKQYRSHRVYVTGEVLRPGPYGLRPDRSLLTLLQDVGELTPHVGHEVLVIRAPAAADPPATDGATNGGGVQAAPTAVASPAPRTGAPLPGEVPGSQVFRLNLRDIRSGYPDKDMRLQIGDTVYLPKAAQVYVTGHVARPGAYRFEEGLTVFQALALAGNPTDRGSNKVKIVRLVDGQRRELRPRMSDPLLPEDTLHVPERFF